MVIPLTPAYEEDDEWSAVDFLRIIYLIFGILGLVGNGLVLFIFLRVPSMRSIPNLLIGNQSLIDLVSSFFLLISKYRIDLVDFSEVNRVRGLVICLCWSSDYIYWALNVSSTTNLVILTLERYVAVFKPVVYSQRINWKSATILAISSWLFGLIFELYWLAAHRLEDGECFPDWRSPLIQAVVGVVVFVLLHILPISVMLCVYLNIIRKLHVRIGTGTNPPNNIQMNRVSRVSGSLDAAQVGRSPQDRGTQEDQESVRRRMQNDPGDNEIRRKLRSNVIKTLSLVSFVFFICWTPNQVIYFLYNLRIYNVDFNGALYTLSVIMAFCNMWINPLIYTFKYRKFQDGLRKVLGRGTSREPIESATWATTGVRN